MMRYLYIDDDKLQDSQSKVSGFQEAGRLEIVAENNLSDWNEQVARLKSKDYDGLILDLKLDETPVSGGRRADFRGSSLAQQLRDLQKEGTLPAFPILLFSGEEKIRSSLDFTGQDLFDLCIDKGGINVWSMMELTTQLIELAECYNRLNKKEDVVEMLRAPFSVDERFLDTISCLQQENSVSACVHLLLKEFIIKPGLLVDDSLLAARLGIDKNMSKEAWGEVLALFEKAQYRGVLGNGWKRWWMRGINEVWKELSGGRFLQLMDAKERVTVLNSVLGITSIVPAQPLLYSESSKFWAVCNGTDAPIDPIDGFVITGQEPHYPWQDFLYVSKKAAFMKINVQRWRSVAASEKARLSILKKEYTN